MGKVITSPSKRWPGTVTLQFPLFMPQAAAFEASLEAVERLSATTTHRQYLHAMLPGVYACIERFDLQGWEALSLDRFPSSKEGIKMAAWLVKEVAAVYAESSADPPKASTPSPTPKALEPSGESPEQRLSPSAAENSKPSDTSIASE